MLRTTLYASDDIAHSSPHHRNRLYLLIIQLSKTPMLSFSKQLIGTMMVHESTEFECADISLIRSSFSLCSMQLCTTALQPYTQEEIDLKCQFRSHRSERRLMSQTSTVRIHHIINIHIVVD